MLASAPVDELLRRRGLRGSPAARHRRAGAPAWRPGSRGAEDDRVADGARGVHPRPGAPLFELRPPAFAGTDWVVKRTFDVVVSALVLVLGLPLWLAIAGRSSSAPRGPVLYRDRRVGLNERQPRCSSSGRCTRTPRAAAGARGRQRGARARCSRSATIRAITRRAIPAPVLLDEFPRVLNVLRGEMSLVGPRPLLVRDRAPRGVAPQALPRAARNDRPMANRRSRRSELRRPRPTGLLLPRTGRSGSTSQCWRRPFQP